MIALSFYYLLKSNHHVYHYQYQVSVKATALLCSLQHEMRQKLFQIQSVKDCATEKLGDV